MKCEMCGKEIKGTSWMVDAWKNLCHTCWRCETQEYREQDASDREAEYPHSSFDV